VNRNRPKIQSWLARDQQRLVDDIVMNDPIGIVVERGRASAFETRKARVVLERDTSTNGWHVLTAYPVK
jgi:hypothetical protein